jgi:hypothetical protein
MMKLSQGDQIHFHENSFLTELSCVRPGVAANLLLTSFSNSEALRTSDVEVIADAVKSLINDVFEPAFHAEEAAFRAGEKRMYLFIQGVSSSQSANAILCEGISKALDRTRFPVPVEVYVDQIITFHISLSFAHMKEDNPHGPWTVRFQEGEAR